MFRTTFAVLTLVISTYAQSTSHEATVVQDTYANVAYLAGVKPVHDADWKPDPNPLTIDVSHIETGRIADIAKRNWGTMFSLPDTAAPVVLVGHKVYRDYSDATTSNTHQQLMNIHWDVDNSYTPQRVNDISSLSVGKAVAMASKEWTVPATYTRYAIFQVTIMFQGRTLGPYTASFFFGRDKNGKEVVAPQDAIVSGQLLWDAVKYHRP